MTQPLCISSQRLCVSLLACVLALSGSACFSESRVIESPSGLNHGDGGTPSGTCERDTDCDGSEQPSRDTALPSGLCKRGGECLEVIVQNVDKVDLLFVIDDSPSMAEKQRSLTAQFPHLIRALATGDFDDDGARDFPPAKDLHLGVVSTDMGAVGAAVTGTLDGADASCMGLGGDGVLRNDPSPHVAGCHEAYPRFLTYLDGLDDPSQSAADLACIATLNTEGCGFEQPLEAALKALWPGAGIEPGAGEERIEFLADTDGVGSHGHGDTDNAGFVRSDPLVGISLLSVVVVTDEDDCSSADTEHFRSDADLPAGHPLRGIPLDLRCHYAPENLHSLSRYVDGLRALRPGYEHLVQFTVIAGVPSDLVSPDELRRIDPTDAAEREAHYTRVMSDPRMQARPAAAQDGGSHTGNLEPSCSTESGSAYPPRRLFETVRAFGENGLALSICDEDLGPAVTLLAERIGRRTGAPCLPFELNRNSEGLTACDVLWELPPPRQATPGTPTRCDQPGFEFLTPDGRPTAGDGVMCKVAQLPVIETASNEDPANDWRPFRPLVQPGSGQGWYYDDFSDEVAQECRPASGPRRIAFSPDAKPPTGVRVYLDCSAQATQP